MITNSLHSEIEKSLLRDNPGTARLISYVGRSLMDTLESPPDNPLSFQAESQKKGREVFTPYVTQAIEFVEVRADSSAWSIYKTPYNSLSLTDKETARNLNEAVRAVFQSFILEYKVEIFTSSHSGELKTALRDEDTTYNPNWLSDTRREIVTLRKKAETKIRDCSLIGDSDLTFIKF